MITWFGAQTEHTTMTKYKQHNVTCVTVSDIWVGGFGPTPNP